MNDIALALVLFGVAAMTAGPSAGDACGQSAATLLAEAQSLMSETADRSLPPGHYARIEDLLERARAAAPRSTDVRVAMASLYGKTGRSEQSAVLLHETLADDPTSADVLATLGYVLRYAGHFGDSIAAYRRAQELDGRLPRRVGAEDQIAKSLIYRGEYLDAVAAYDRIFAWLGEAGRHPDEKMLFYQGVALLYAGRTQEAIARFTGAEAIDPASLWSRFGRAYRAMARGDAAELRRIAEAIAAEDPVDGERHYRLVHFYAHLGEVTAAVAHLKTTLARGFFAHPYLERDPLSATLRDVPAWRRLIGEARARHARFPVRPATATSGQR